MKKEKTQKQEPKQHKIDFRNEGIADVQFSSGMVNLSGIYRVRLTWQKCLLAVALGAFFSIATLFFIQNTGLYSGGSTAIFQGLARLVNTVMNVQEYGETITRIVYNLMFWGIYLLFNVGLLLFYMKTMNKEFVYLSAIYVCTSQVLGICLGLIPGIADIQIFGNTSTVNEVLKNSNVECIIFYPNIYPVYVDPTATTAGFFNWTQQLTTANEAWIKSDILTENISKSFSLLLYAIMFSFIYAFCNAGIYIIGGSSMGTESLAIYVSEKKNKDVGTMLKTIQMFCLIVGIVVGSYVTGMIAGNSWIDKNPGCQASLGTYASWQYIINANLVASLIYVFLNGALINALFPTRKLVRVEIFTHEAKKVLDNLRIHKYPHPSTVVNSFGGYSGANNNIIVTVLPVMALTDYINTIREVDKVCLIAVTTLDDCVGRIGLEKHTNLKRAYDLKMREKKAAENTKKQLANVVKVEDINKPAPQTKKVKKTKKTKK